jgi:hypothetical protein
MTTLDKDKVLQAIFDATEKDWRRLPGISQKWMRDFMTKRLNAALAEMERQGFRVQSRITNLDQTVAACKAFSVTHEMHDALTAAADAAPRVRFGDGGET